MIGYLTGIAVVAMVVTVLPLVSAFESNTVNVTSFVKQPIVT